MTWVDLNENGIEGNLGLGLGNGTFETVDVPGDRIGIAGTAMSFKNVTVTRNDWANMLSGNAFNSSAANFADWDVYNRTVCYAEWEYALSAFNSCSWPNWWDTYYFFKYNGTLSRNAGFNLELWRSD